MNGISIAGTIAFMLLDAATSYGNVAKREVLRRALSRNNPEELRMGAMASFNPVLEAAYNELRDRAPDGPAKEYLLSLMETLDATRCLACQSVTEPRPIGFHLPKLHMASVHKYTTPFDPAYSAHAIPDYRCESCNGVGSVIKEPAKLPRLLIVPLPEMCHVCQVILF
jgi:hypothetical protein